MTTVSRTDFETPDHAREFLLRELCEECFTPVRRLYREYDAAEAEALATSSAVETFLAKGHRVAEDGSIEAASPTTLPDPDATTAANAPPRNHVRAGTGSKTFCSECGAVAQSGWPHIGLTNRERYELFEDVCEALEDYGISLSPGRGKWCIHARNRQDHMAGRDTDVLAEALFVATESYRD